MNGYKRADLREKLAITTVSSFVPFVAVSRMDANNSEQSGIIEELQTDIIKMPRLPNGIVYTSVDRDFFDDFYKEIDINLIPESDLREMMRRNHSIVRKMKKKRDYTCQICGENRFLMDNGDYYCEAHHINHIGQGGSQTDESNIIILCANHHRKFHYAKKGVIGIGEMKCGRRKITIDDENRRTVEVDFN